MKSHLGDIDQLGQAISFLRMFVMIHDSLVDIRNRLIDEEVKRN